MKIKMLRSALVPDTKRGTMVSRNKGEEFDFNHTELEEKEILFSLIGFTATVIDTEFVPLEARYVVLHGFSERGRDEKLQSFRAGEIYALSQELAAMACGKVKPEDPKQWTPRKLLWDMPSDKPARKMFDEPVTPREPWRVRRDRDGSY